MESKIESKIRPFFEFLTPLLEFDSGRRESSGIAKIKRKVYVGLSVRNRRELRSGVKN